MIRNLAIFLLCFGLQNNVLAQLIDSLERQLTKEGLPVNERVDAINELSRILTFINPGRALDLANEAMNLSATANYRKGTAYAYRNLSGIYQYNDIFFPSMDYLQKAFQIFRELGDTIGTANCYISLGHIYRKLNNREEEIKAHERAYTIFRRANIPERIGVTAHNLGETYYLNGDYDKAIALTEEAVHFTRMTNNLPVLSSCIKVLGQIAYKQNKLAEARSHFNNVLSLSRQLGANSQKIATVEALQHLSYISRNVGDPAGELRYLNQAVQFCSEHGLHRHHQEILEQLIHIHVEQQDGKAVIRYVQDLKKVTEIINANQAKDREELVASVSKVYDLEADKARFSEDAIAQEEKIAFRNTVIVITLVSVSLMGALLIALYYINLKLKQYNERIQQQAKTIEIQKQRLEELNETKDRFFSIVAHDLKSPLNSLKSFSGLIIKHLDRLSKDDLRQMSEELHTSVDNTIKLADDLIAWANIQMKEVQQLQETIIVSEVVDNTCLVYKDVAREKDIRMDCIVEAGLRIKADRRQIEFVLRNLANNAVKYTGRGGQISLKANRVGDSVVFHVIDNGMGIPQDVIKQLFSVGKKPSMPGTQGEKGTGLGLMLSYEFVKLNGGDIAVKSEEGRGTEVTVTFPLAD